MHLRATLAALTVAVSFGVATVADAQVRGVTISNDGIVVDNAPWNLGYSFTVLSATSVVSLGVWDHLQDGLKNRHEVGLWNSGGFLLASAFVGAGTSGILDGNFRYTNIGPVALNIGSTYFVAASFSGPGDDAWTADPSSVVTAPQIAYDSRRYQSGSTLVFPDLAGSNGTGYWGGDVRLASNTVPEPASVVLIGLGLGALGIAARRRRVSL